MKRLFLLVLLAIVASLPTSTGRSRADDGSGTIVGFLSYIPVPDVSICFCGSFRLTTEASPKECYLVSDSIDLGAFIGQRVLVYGKAFSGICSGTLARSCSYFEVEKIVALTRAGTLDITWGFVKGTYR